MSSFLGATFVTKKFGARNAIIVGMGLYCFQVGCFFLATVLEEKNLVTVVILLGAVVGGLGGGFAWTAQVSNELFKCILVCIQIVL